MKMNVLSLKMYPPMTQDLKNATPILVISIRINFLKHIRLLSCLQINFESIGFVWSGSLYDETFF